jgi:hypothetical protein
MDRRAYRLNVALLWSLPLALPFLASACGTTKAPHDGAADGKSDGAAEAPAPVDMTGNDAGDVPPEAPADMAPADVPPDADGGVDLPPEAPAPDVPEETSPDASADLAPEAPADLASDQGPDAAADLGVEAGDAFDTALPPDFIACENNPVPGSHLVVEYDGNNAEWVRTLRWKDSTGTLTTFNINASGGDPGCSSVPEFFGQAYAAPEGNGPYPIGSNTVASVTGCGTVDQTIVSRALDCTGAPQIPVTTVYHFYTGTKADQVRVTRTIGFTATTGTTTGVGMRVFVPRIKRANYSNVLIPNGAGTAVTNTSVNSCGSDCLTATGASWNGKWFADVDPNTGYAVIVLRDPSLTSDVSLTVNNDSNSASNLSSFVLMQPAGGWTAPVTETYYLCFADLSEWPQASRDAATLPATCGP